MTTISCSPAPSSLLRVPSWRGTGVDAERELPLEPGDYKVTPATIAGPLSR